MRSMKRYTHIILSNVIRLRTICLMRNMHGIRYTSDAHAPPSLHVRYRLSYHVDTTFARTALEAARTVIGRVVPIHRESFNHKNNCCLVKDI